MNCRRQALLLYLDPAIVVVTAESGDPPQDPRGGDVPRWQLCPDAGLREAAPHGGNPVGQQEIHEYEASGGGFGRRRCCRLTSFSRSLQINLRIIFDGAFEFWRISFVWYSFWHSKTPHLLDSISYCLTSGVQFTVAAGLLLYFCRLGTTPSRTSGSEPVLKTLWL